MKQQRFFIYGVPGVGKTTFAKNLSKKTSLKVIEGDGLRKKVKARIPGTCQAYKKFGALNEKNAIRGLVMVRKALNQIVENEISLHKQIILEAAFLDPAKLIKRGQVILLVTNDEKRHKRQFLHHREKLFDFKGNEFKAARIIQEYLIAEASKLRLEIIESDKVNL